MHRIAEYGRTSVLKIGYLHSDQKILTFQLKSSVTQMKMKVLRMKAASLQQ